MKKAFIRTGLAIVITTILTACGGGGGGDTPISSISSNNSSSSNRSNPTSYWNMDSYEYINGGYSGVSTNIIGGVPVTVAVISTATLSGGDSSNGIYSGSVLAFSFKGTPAAGVYTVVPNRAAFAAADISTSPMLVEVDVGVARNTGSSHYVALSGQVQATRDTAGAYHFTSVALMPAAKTLDVLGGVAGAPSAMALSIVDAY